jgi:SpoVK/Ycf46/Vps4 family AAA+-type ATPase
LTDIAGLPEVERLATLRDAAQEDDPILFVYGPGTDDAFIDTAYRMYGLEEALWEGLHAAGFERIGFYSLTRKLYFRDEESLRAVRPVRPGQASRPARRRMRAGFSGPLGDRIVGGVGSGPASSEPAPSAPPEGASGVGFARGMGDPFSVQMFNHLMREGAARTALVFVDAEETLRLIEAVRGLAGFFAHQVSYRPEAPHTCVLVFRRPTLSDVSEFLAGIGSVPALAAASARQVERSSQPGLVGYPGDAELTRLIHVLRIREGLRVEDLRQLPAIVRAMSAQVEEARRWTGRLRQLATKGVPLSRLSLGRRIKSPVPDAGGVWKQLERMPGLFEVKRHLASLSSRLEADALLRAEGLVDAEPGSHHLVFTGNPGTGKTTVARLVGEMYRDLGILSRGHVVEASVSDLVAAYVGGTAPKTSALVDRALDGVLFIDEAYQLSDQQSGFGQEAIDTLLARMENDRAQLVVIVAGYPAKMDEFLAANQGLRSRFPVANVIEFSDYDPPTLQAILLNRLRSRGLTWTPELEQQLGPVIAGMHRTRRAGFGNARAMREVADEIVTRWAERTRPDIHQPADTSDLPDRLRVYMDQAIPDIRELLGELDSMTGLQPVKDAIHTLVNQIRLKQRRGRGTVIAPHLLFLGPPGTGKTTVARLMGRIFKTLGLLVKGDMNEVGRSQLVAGYIGQTAIKTTEQIEAALDGVLFIDEAYSLAVGGDGQDFGREALDTLNQQMENLRGRIVVIAAGYPDRMEEFLAANPGLASRFNERVEFPDYSGAELLEILRGMATAEGYHLTPEAEQLARAWFEAERSARPGSFGNGRAARKLLSAMEARLGARLATTADDAGESDLSTFQAQDVPDVRR